MIPFSALMLRLRYIDGQTLDARAVELPPGGIVYRVPKDYPERPAAVECGFYDPHNGGYDIVTVTNFDISPRESELGRAFLMTSTDAAFLGGIKRVTADYTHYIELKLSLDENEAARELTGLDVNCTHENGQA